MDLLMSQDLINSLGVGQIVDIRGQLPTNPKYTWAQKAGVRAIEQLTTIAIHHDAYPKQNRAGVTDIQLMTEIAREHIKLKKNDTNGDPGFPYHFWIRGNTAYYCNDILDKTWGVSSNNGYTVHVCVSGDFHNYDYLTEFERKTLYAVILTLKEALPNYKEWRGHKDFPNIPYTDCPGIDLERVKNDLQTVENRLVYEKSRQYKAEVAFAIANQIQYMINLAQGKNSDGTAASEGDIIWAVNTIMDLYPFMKDKGLLK